MAPRALSVAIVSQNRDELRQLSWLLAEFGYHVCACAQLPTALEGLTCGRIDILIVDDALPDVVLDQAPLFRRTENRYVYTLLLCNPSTSPNVVDALEWGIDDWLQKPINRGEILSRLRTAARFLEFERRLEEQATRDHLTKLFTCGGLAAVLRQRVSRGNLPCPRQALLALDIDFFARVNRVYGWQQGDAILQGIATTLTASATEHDLVARLGEDRFAIVTPAQENDDGRARAASIRKEVESLKWPQDPRLSLTASVAYLVFDALHDALENTIGLVNDAIRHAKNSGRNCIVRAGEYDLPFEEWHKELNSGNPFADATARDLMQPFSFVLSSSADLDRARKQLQQSALDSIPVIDRNRSLIGMLDRAALGDGFSPANGEAATTSRLPLTKPLTVAEDMPMSHIAEKFSHLPCSLVVVVREQEPRGYITREGFLSLMEPVSTGSFRPVRPVSAGTDYLVVPEITPSKSCSA